MAREVRIVLHHRPVNKAGTARPLIFWKRITNDRDISKIRQAFHPLLCKISLIQIMGPAATPIQHHGPSNILHGDVFHHRLNRSKAGAAGEKNNWLGAVFTQKEGALWALEPQNVFFFHRIGRWRARPKECIGKCAARCMPNMQLNDVVLMGRTCHRIAAPLTVF